MYEQVLRISGEWPARKRASLVHSLAMPLLPVRGSVNVRLNRGIAFTLLELLVTISIISILLALSVTYSLRTKEAARRTRCEALLRQFYLTIRIYADENEECLAPYDYFVKKMPMVCPSDKSNGAIGVFVRTSFDFSSFAFGSRQRLDGLSGDSWLATEIRPFHDPSRRPSFQPGKWRGRFNSLHNDGSVHWTLMEQ